MTTIRPQPLLLFDGVCHLCNGSVHFVLDHEQAPTLRFAPLASQAAHDALTAREVNPTTLPDSLVLVDGEGVWFESTAALRVASHLRWPWRAAVLFRVVPAPVRDVVYRWIARNRYRWFGKLEACRLPPAGSEGRFVE